jgi:tRNA (guanine37-N1)-methyltransferase
MRFDVITIFPELFETWRGSALLGKALQKNLFQLNLIDLKKFSGRRDGRVDDRPYGGGPGMLLRVAPVTRALESIENWEDARKIHLSPSGALWTQGGAENVKEDAHIICLCSRYEGVDQRVIELGNFEEISLGNYVVMGGELPAMLLMESVLRLVPGVLGSRESTLEESFSSASENLLDCPHYTRPEIFRSLKVPEVLLSGNHALIKNFRKKESKKRELKRKKR